MHVLRGLTVDELTEKFKGLDREDIAQAIRYCVTHPGSVREQATSPLTVEVAERQSRSRKSVA